MRMTTLKAIVLIGVLGGLAATTACTWRGGAAVDGQQAVSNRRGDGVQLAQSDDKARPTIREQQNERAGGSSIGGSTAPAPGTVQPQGGGSSGGSGSTPSPSGGSGSSGSAGTQGGGTSGSGGSSGGSGG